MTENREKSDQYQLRLPDGMREELAASAKANGRSINSEIVLRLSAGGLAETRVPHVTLRQWYAGQALAGLLAFPGKVGPAPWKAHNFASAAFEYADAMIAFEQQEGDAS